MATAREHLELAAEMADEAYEISASHPEESLAVATVASAHALIARGLLDLDRLAWLQSADREFTGRAIEDLPLTTTNSESAPDATDAPSTTPEGA